MATYTFRLPDIGEGIAEAEIVVWHVKIGDTITEDQPIADMMTDKATVEIETPVGGVVTALGGEAGDKIAIGSPLIVVEVGDAELTSAKAETPTDGPQVVSSERPADSQSADVADVQEPAVATTSSCPVPLASPAVRDRAKNLGIDLGQVSVLVGGRVRHADLDAYLSYNAERGFGASAATRPDDVIKVIGLRRRIAENMAASKRHIPHFSYVDEIDVTALEATRAALNAERGSKPKLTLLPLLITAVCQAIPEFPMMNARFDDEAGVVTRFGAVHLGIATQTEHGLMVPVIRNAEAMNVWQLAAEISRLADAARNGTAKSGELSGSTLTITSLGPLGGIATTPVINRPEVAIIGPNRIIERPIFAKTANGGDVITRAKLMNLSISCDHRVVDGWDAANFIQTVKRRLETPVLLFAPE